jgi:hypothetical protein
MCGKKRPFDDQFRSNSCDLIEHILNSGSQLRKKKHKTKDHKLWNAVAVLC